MKKAESIRQSRGSYALNLLLNYNRNKLEIENLKLAIEEISLENDGVSAIDYSRDKTGPTNKITRMVEDLAINNIDKKEWYKNKLKKKEIELKKIDNAMKLLDERTRDIITMYYIDKMSMNDISAKVNLVIPYCSTIKNRGIKEIEKVIF